MKTLGMIAIMGLGMALMAPLTLPPTRILVVGDSISNYDGGLETVGWSKFVRGARVATIPTNAGNSGHTLANVDDWLHEKADVILWNNGLHDLIQTPAYKYRANLEAIADKMLATGATVVWVSTTPTIGDDRARFARYREIADGVMAEKGIATIDLGRYVAFHQFPHGLIDGVHWKLWAAEGQGAFITTELHRLGALP